jgi:predicted DNA-binding transcriptional regulator AlpA
MRYYVSPAALQAGLPHLLLDRREVCRFFGGTKPLNPATLYRGIRDGRFPSPVKVGGSSRWLRAECEAALASMVSARRDGDIDG